MTNEEIKEKLYNIIDSYLVEVKDKDGNERINLDKHLAIQDIFDFIKFNFALKEDIKKEFEKSRYYNSGYRQAIEEIENKLPIYNNT
jgi:hypothetical protein